MIVPGEVAPRWWRGLGPARDNHVLTGESDMESALVELRGLYRGPPSPSCAPPTWRKSRSWSDKAPGTPSRLCRRAAIRVWSAAASPSVARALADPPRPDPRGRSRERHHDRGSRLHPQGCSGCRRCGGLPVSALAGVRGFVPDRREPGDECGRNRGSALWQRPRPRAGARSRARRRAHLERAERLAEGQHGLRPQEPVHRFGGNARHHYGGRAQTLPEAQARVTAFIGCASPHRALELFERMRRPRATN